jgi:hypothetical protein
MLARIVISLTAAIGAGAALLPGPNGAGDITFRKHIAPMLAAKCVSCHSPGGVGPFSLLTYEDSRKRADLIQTVAILQKMPPTRAESDFGTLCTDQRLTDNEIVQIQEWVHSGMPEGAGPAPKISTPKRDWQLGQPDLIVKPIAPIVVPAEGDQVTRYAVVDLPMSEDRDLVAFDIKPSSPGAARRAVLATEDSLGRTAFSDRGIDAKRMIGAWATGANLWRLPPNAGITLAPRTKLRLRLLYHATGKVEDGGFELGLYFAKSPRPVHPLWVTLGRTDFELTGKEPYYTDVEASSTLTDAAKVVSVVPEARGWARTVRLTAKMPGWERSVLLINPWDWRWAGAYNFEKPTLIPAGAALESTISYYNSTHDDPSLTIDQIKRLPLNPSIFFGPTDKDELSWVHVQLVPDK